MTALERKLAKSILINIKVSQWTDWFRNSMRWSYLATTAPFGIQRTMENRGTPRRSAMAEKCRKNAWNSPRDTIPQRRQIASSMALTYNSVRTAHRGVVKSLADFEMQSLLQHCLERLVSNTLRFANLRTLNVSGFGNFGHGSLVARSYWELSSGKPFVCMRPCHLTPSDYEVRPDFVCLF